MRLIAPLIGTLLLVGFVLKYWVLIALVLTAVAVWKYGPGWWARHQATAAAQRRRLAAIAARADQQHQWTLVGDPRGTYGHLFLAHPGSVAAHAVRPGCSSARRGD